MDHELNQTEDFVELMTEFQGRLFGYILSLVCDPDEANEVLQETNLVLWRKSSEFTPGTSFKAWSFRVASFQVMAYRQRRIRDRLVFDEDLFRELCVEAKEVDDAFEGTQDLLTQCITRLKPYHRELVTKRYSFGASVKTIAAELGRTANSIAQTLFRIRQNLVKCVKLAGAEREK